MARWTSWFFLMVAIASVPACSELRARRVTDNVPVVRDAGTTATDGTGTGTPPQSAAGITYYLSKPVFRVDLLATASGKVAAPEYRAIVNYVADPTQRYELGLTSGLFSSDVFDLSLTEDGRLSALNASITDTTPEHIKSLGELVVAAAGAVAPLSAPSYLRSALETSVQYNLILETDKTDLIALRNNLPGATRSELEHAKAILVQKNVVKKFSEHLGSRFKHGIATNKENEALFDEQMKLSLEWRELVKFAELIESQLTPSVTSEQGRLTTYFKDLRKKLDLATINYINPPKQPNPPAPPVALKLPPSLPGTVAGITPPRFTFVSNLNHVRASLVALEAAKAAHAAAPTNATQMAMADAAQNLTDAAEAQAMAADQDIGTYLTELTRHYNVVTSFNDLNRLAADVRARARDLDSAKAAHSAAPTAITQATLAGAEQNLATATAALAAGKDEKSEPKRYEAWINTSSNAEDNHFTAMKAFQKAWFEYPALLTAHAGKDWKTEFELALIEYTKALGLVVAVDEALNHRDLASRRKVLIDFLKTAVPAALPTGDGASQWYLNLRTELDHIDGILAKMIPGSSATPNVITATEITRIYDDLETVYLPRGYLKKWIPREIFVLGEAYWRFGVHEDKKKAGLDGVVIYFVSK